MESGLKDKKQDEESENKRSFSENKKEEEKNNLAWWFLEGLAAAGFALAGCVAFVHLLWWSSLLKYQWRSQ